MEKISETGCCPIFKPELWDGKEFIWKDKLFVRDRVKSIFHIPLNFGGIVKKNNQLMESTGALNTDNMMLSDENSLWGADLYIASDKQVPSAKMEKLSGNFIAKTFEGPYSNAGKWAKETEQFVKSKGKNTKRILFWYTTCPKCAKVYGKNPVVVFAQV